VAGRHNQCRSLLPRFRNSNIRRAIYEIKLYSSMNITVEKARSSILDYKGYASVSAIDILRANYTL